MEEFKRENRYVVLKRKDVRGTLTPEEQGQLNSVCDRIEEQRRLLAKPKLRCVVVESDWKIYNEVWALVQQESEGTLPQQSIYERLANQVADLKREKGELQSELEAARKDHMVLRRLLFIHITDMQNCYYDDGELQDNGSPPIDFRRDSAKEVERKILERGSAKLAAQIAASKPAKDGV